MINAKPILKYPDAPLRWYIIPLNEVVDGFVVCKELRVSQRPYSHSLDGPQSQVFVHGVAIENLVFCLRESAEAAIPMQHRS